MECDRCRASLDCRARADLTYYECSGCSGLWFNPGELENLVRHRIALDFQPSGSHSEAEETGPFACPVCGSGVRLIPMSIHAGSPIKTHACPVCYGHWLTRTQAAKLVHNMRYPGLSGWIRRIFRRRSQ